MWSHRRRLIIWSKITQFCSFFVLVIGRGQQFIANEYDLTQLESDSMWQQQFVLIWYCYDLGSICYCYCYWPIPLRRWSLLKDNLTLFYDCKCNGRSHPFVLSGDTLLKPIATLLFNTINIRPSQCVTIHCHTLQTSDQLQLRFQTTQHQVILCVSTWFYLLSLPASLLSCDTLCCCGWVIIEQLSHMFHMSAAMIHVFHICTLHTHVAICNRCNRWQNENIGI